MSEDPPDDEYHLNQIERHVQALRGDTPEDVTPWDFRLPTGEELRDMRKACGLSQEQAGDIMDYSHTHVRGVETGSQSPGREFIRRALIVYRREWPR